MAPAMIADVMRFRPWAVWLTISMRGDQHAGCRSYRTSIQQLPRAWGRTIATTAWSAEFEGLRKPQTGETYEPVAAGPRPAEWTSERQTREHIRLFSVLVGLSFSRPHPREARATGAGAEASSFSLRRSAPLRPLRSREAHVAVARMYARSFAI